MKIGDLVKNRHDPTTNGIVLEIGPAATHTDHGKRVYRVQWSDGVETFEFIKILEILSEGR